MTEMTPRQRMMTAMRHEIPDRIPVAPDISNMVPCRLTQKPFWDIYINHKPPIWKAYIDASRYFGMDGWVVTNTLNLKTSSPVETSQSIHKTNERWYVTKVHKTLDGYLQETIVSPVADSPTSAEKLIKNFKNDFKKIRHIFSEIISYDDEPFFNIKKEIGEDAMLSSYVGVPGFNEFVGYFNGNLEAVVYAYMDEPELFHELCALHEKRELQKLEILLDHKIDGILTGGSGSVTLQSPAIWRELSLPSIKKITKMCKEAGVISGIHSCGVERYLIESCAAETDLNYVNPLELPPMGDCTIAGIRQKVEDRLCLMGNLHTTETMLMGSVDDVCRESLKAMIDGGINGNFILSTGDQPGRDTPDKNIFAMVNTAKIFGTYPLKTDVILAEIDRLVKA
jgi:uroporphyrinogen decarboxylase